VTVFVGEYIASAETLEDGIGYPGGGTFDALSSALALCHDKLLFPNLNDTC